MKDWHGTVYHGVADAEARNALAEISDYLFQLSPSIGRISRGEQPNSSGQPLVPEVDTSNFFYLPGPVARRTVVNAGLGTSTVGATGEPWQRFVYAGITKLEIAPILNNGGVVDLALNVNSGSVQFIDSTVSTTGLRIAFSSARAFVQTGRVNSGGTVLNKNLTIGGMNATCGIDLSLNFNTSNFDSSGTDSDGWPRVGIGSPPSARTGTGSGAQPVLTVLSGQTSDVKFDTALYIGVGDGTQDSVEFIKFGRSPGASTYFGFTRNGRFNLYNSGTLSSFVSGTTFAFEINTSIYNIFNVQNTNSFTDGSGKGTLQFRLGDGLAANGNVRWVAFTSTTSGGAAQPLDRLAIQAKLVMVCDGALETTGDFTPPTAMLHIKSTLSNSTVLLNLQRKSGQTGNLFQLLDSDGTTVLAQADKDAIVTVPGILVSDLTSGTYVKATTSGRLTSGPTPLAGTKIYYVADSSGGAVTRKLTFTDGILTAET